MALAGVAATLERLIDEARARRPEWPIERSAFRRHVASCLDEDAPDDPGALERLHVADLYLAYACTVQVTAAQREFAAGYMAPVATSLKRRLANAPVSADDVRREVEDSFLFGRNGSSPRLALYTGRGPLERFVAKAARNAALSLLRVRRNFSSGDVDTLASQIAGPGEGSESFVVARYEPVVRDALRSALARLDRRQRLVVRLHLVQGVTQTQIARMLKVHQTTISRAFDGALETIHDEIRRQLGRLEGMDESEMMSIVRDVRSRIELSLSRLLKSTYEAG